MTTEGDPVQVAVRVLGVSESGFYAWRDRGPSARSIRHVLLTDAVRQIHAASSGVDLADGGCTPNSPWAAGCASGMGRWRC
ncbi:hypothetical protein [Nocardiopsis synnemataformans]|uniref:hypothetical protein n=1 Tax=Nocardiopsis synnemataformans TaxID=61305 RepID=UPI003EB9DBB0